MVRESLSPSTRVLQQEFRLLLYKIPSPAAEETGVVHYEGYWSWQGVEGGLTKRSIGFIYRVHGSIRPDEHLRLVQVLPSSPLNFRLSCRQSTAAAGREADGRGPAANCQAFAEGGQFIVLPRESVSGESESKLKVAHWGATGNTNFSVIASLKGG